MADIRSKITHFSDKHVLKTAPEPYIASFIAAATRVYPASQIDKILQERFFLPDDTHFDLQAYLQSAAELSVQNHLKLSEQAKNIAIGKQVNPPKDVDCYYEVEATHISLEVKCAVETPLSDEALTLITAGRTPNHLSLFNELKTQLEAAQSDKSLELGKNKDNTLKDFLTLAQGKFAPNSGVDDLNILFIACDDYFNMQHWYFYLFGGQGLFTNASFHPRSDFNLVDVVVLSNLKYCHDRGKEYHDWTLKNVFMLPVLNPNRRSSALSESIVKGLMVFDHHLKGFGAYVPSDNDPGAPHEIANNIRLSSYVVDGMNRGERERYFPTLSFTGPPINPPVK